jgi:hypothetical protein
MSWLKRLFCKHYKQTFIRNIYGDEINHLNARSVWKCDKCGKYILDQNLVTARESPQDASQDPRSNDQ